ncbi:MAG: KTSC domain-containing protein [Bdellovibrionaceae bacterium]|nr:KTSC domain-containing protein [Pseudobdellovibrionaceae bacterium]
MDSEEFVFTDLSSSSWVDSCEYSESQKILRVHLQSKDSYEYYNVSETTYAEFISADSHGTYLNRYIKPYHKFDAI